MVMIGVLEGQLKKANEDLRSEHGRMTKAMDDLCEEGEKSKDEKWAV